MNTHSAILTTGSFTAFIDGIPDTCNHDMKGDVVLESRKGKMIYWHTYRQWASLTTEARVELIMKYHEEIDDCIIASYSGCSKCKKTHFPNMFDF